ncbi:fibrinogen-like YCDxxxxGGGW domain-containing protein [Archangium gephyra]|uniref:fibrinogen-like YCDxxxxGGGW domain-containing protein n=1 Tax=Archangium gephyra TaxID=48 RepID=UPI0035D43B42
MRFILDRTSCKGEPVAPFHLSVDKLLEDIRLPGGLPDFEDAPLDSDSSHTFADLFIDLAAGCYQVVTQPLAAGGGVSMDCERASTSGVRVVDGRTTEILLINQCLGEGRGGIDVVSALNHPPELTKLAFEDSKFVLQCMDQVVCATVKDPDEDPVEFVWKEASGPPLYVPPEVVSTTTAADGSVTQCVRTVAETVGRYELTVTVYDLLHDTAAGGKLIRIEDYFTSMGDPHASRAALTFPFYAADDGEPGGCASVSCKSLLEKAPGTPSGLYELDPDGAGPLEPFEAYCDMVTDGGGWTLTMVSSDDSQVTWIWEKRTLMTTDTTPVGNVRERNKDFKSPAQHSVPFKDLLFVHAPSGQWAAYGGVGTGSTSIASFMAGISEPVCEYTLAGNGYKLTAGTISATGKLCDTDLYFHLGDFDGFGSESYCRGLYNDSTYGPSWNLSNNAPCPFDDSAGASFGPVSDPRGTAYESEAAGFGYALGLNSGTPGEARNYIQMYVR